MTLYDQLVPQPVTAPETTCGLQAPGVEQATREAHMTSQQRIRASRVKRQRQTKAMRDAAQAALTAEIKEKLARWDREQAAERAELIRKSSQLPPGVTVVGPIHEGVDA